MKALKRADVIKAVGVALVVSTSVYGLCQATVATIRMVNKDLDNYAVNRVIRNHLINEAPKLVTVQVPVITQASAEDLLKATAR